MIAATAHGETLLLDCASIGSCAIPWIGQLLKERAATRGRTCTHMFPSLEEALWTLETLPAGSEVVLMSHLTPNGERAHHAYFGQRWGLTPHELLAAMVQEGAVRIAEFMLPPLSPDERMRMRCVNCMELMLTVPAGADRSWLDWALSLTAADREAAWSCRDALDAFARGGAPVAMRCSDAPTAPGERCSLMHHAGPRDLCGTAPARMHAKGLWASPSRAFAACFGMACVREGRAMHGLDLLAPCAKVTVSVEIDTIIRELDDSWMAMHCIQVPARCAVRAGVCSHLEFLVDGPVDLTHVERMRTADALKRFGVQVEHPETAYDGLFSEYGLSETIWEGLLGCRRIEVERYASLRRSAAAWLPDALGRPPSSIPFFTPALSARLLRRAVLPEIGASVSFPVCGHGERHAYVISHLALLIAVLEDIPPIAPAIAGALHDIGRRDDAEDSDHPSRGAAIAQSLVPTLRSAALSSEACAAVVSAIESHSEDGPASCPVSAVLRDADRLPLAWERGFDARHFSTGVGRAIAQGGPPAAERLFREQFGQCLFDTVGFREPIGVEP